MPFDVTKFSLFTVVTDQVSIRRRKERFRGVDGIDWLIIVSDEDGVCGTVFSEM